MIRSMTGFGRCRETVEGLDITVEIKSVNSRFLDCTAKISRAYGYLEERVKPYLMSRGVTRGKVDVWISVDVMDSGSVEITADEGYLQGYLEALYTLRDKYNLRDDISVMSVARNHDIFQIKKPEEDIEHDWERVLTVLAKAVDTFLTVREREGERLAEDLRGKMQNIKGAVDRIEELSALDVSTYRERLAERIREALNDNQITPDETRLLTECAIHADKVAVDEEMVRLRTHFGAFEEIAQSTEPAGRKLDFLVQEMNRETNTIGSKASNADTAHLVVNIKNELEKIREQIQNIE
jgi:uncharacterized protein (TIGR00255 family)